MNRRARLNLWVDALAFSAFVLMAATGLVLKLVLPPGSGRVAGEGIGAHPGRGGTVSLLWGLTRHEWGNIHFAISVALFAILSLHLILHGRWIACMVRGKEREGSALKFALGLFGLLALLAFALAPFFSRVERLARREIEARRAGAVAPQGDD